MDKTEKISREGKNNKAEISLYATPDWKSWIA